MIDQLYCIDPGTTTGVAILAMGAHQPEAVLALESHTFIDVLHRISDEAGGTHLAYQTLAVVIEDNRNQPIHGKRRTGRSRADLKIARDVGRIDLMVDLLEQAARKAGFPAVLVPSTTSKWDAKRMRQITGYEKGGNEHTRDAVRAGWGVTRRQINESR